LGEVTIKDTFRFGADDGALRLRSKIAGGSGAGILILKDADGHETLRLDGTSGAIAVKGSGDITLRGADCAEDFEIADGEEDLEPGSVVVVDEAGKLQLATTPYDRRVIGVLSGAGAHRPAVVMGREQASTRAMPLPLMGKTYCKTDADRAPIVLGDLLTTSPTPGHAMKATDPNRAFGATIGKALRPLGKGMDLIPILVAFR
jgi:hypothetical protein